MCLRVVLQIELFYIYSWKKTHVQERRELQIVELACHGLSKDHPETLFPRPFFLR
jgi:hypothetical protein